MNESETLFPLLLAGGFVSALLLTTTTALFPRSTSDYVQLTRIERKLDLLLAHLGIEDTARPSGPVADLLRSGRKIEAIKAYREEHGVGLREAKEAVDEIERTL